MGEPDEVTDEELARVVERVRAIRRKERRAKLVGVGLGVALTVALFGGSYLVVPPARSHPGDGGAVISRFFTRRNDFGARAALASLGLLIGGLVYTNLSPREHPDDVE